MREIDILVRVKNKLLALYKTHDMRLALWSVAIFLVGIFILVILTSTGTVSSNYLWGWMLGCCFAWLGYAILVGSCWLVQYTLNSYLFYTGFIIRMMFYALAIIIFAYHSRDFNIFMLVGGLAFIHIAIYLSQLPLFRFAKKH